MNEGEISEPPRRLKFLGRIQRNILIAFSVLLLAGAPSVSVAAQDGAGHGDGFASAFLWIAVILVVAKFASLVERIGQPSVLGELLAGIVLGNLALLGITVFEPLKDNTFIEFLAELGVVILLFQIGLESNLREMKSVGMPALSVALLGVVIPFVLGVYVVGPWLFPDFPFATHLFLGAALTATSVGITARVFRDLGKLQTKEAKTILGAAVIDDVLGLVILAVVSGFVTAGAISGPGVALIIGKAVLFLGGAVVFGQMAAPWLGAAFSKINTGVGMKFTLAISFGLVFASLAQAIGLAPIVGAFAAGLVLDAVHFRFFRNPEFIEEIREATNHGSWRARRQVSAVLEKHSRQHIEELLEPLAYLFVPVFFVYTAMSVDLSTLGNPPVLGAALAVTAIAVLGKVVSGLASGDANKLVVGFGMVPRGEVGLIFAAIGQELGVVSAEVFSVIVLMVILTTLLTPPVLALFLRRGEGEKEVSFDLRFLFPVPAHIRNRKQ